MGSLGVPRMSESAICAAYRAGATRTDICLQARIYGRELLDVLKRNGVPLRTDAECKALSAARRAVCRERQRQRLQSRA